MCFSSIATNFSKWSWVAAALFSFRCNCSISLCSAKIVWFSSFNSAWGNKGISTSSAENEAAKHHAKPHSGRWPSQKGILFLLSPFSKAKPPATKHGAGGLMVVWPGFASPIASGSQWSFQSQPQSGWHRPPIRHPLKDNWRWLRHYQPSHCHHTKWKQSWPHFHHTL